MNSDTDRGVTHGPDSSAPPGVDVESCAEEGADPALEWAARFVDILDSQQLTHRPWGTTYRLLSDEGTCFLKVLPSSLAPVLPTLHRLSARFPRALPTIVQTDERAGFLLMNSHEGDPLGRTADEEDRTLLLSRYAQIQAEVAGDSELMANCQTVDPDSIVDELMAFLTPTGRLPTLPGAVVHANEFLSTRRCRAYAESIRRRAELLQEFLASSTILPLTINHGDLRPANAARIPGNSEESAREQADGPGGILIYDWDECVTGPAGLSLHAMFSGTLNVLQVMENRPLFSHPESLRQPRRELYAYRDALVSGGYATAAELTRALPASALAGMLHHIIGFSRFTSDSRRYRRTVRRNIGKRLSDLFDVCDYLGVTRDGNILDYAEDYRDSGRGWRARRLLNEHLRLHPEHASARELLADLYYDDRRFPVACRHYRKAVEVLPDDPQLHAKAGDAYTRRGDLSTAKRHFRQSLRSRDASAVREKLDHANRLEQVIDNARRPGTVPCVALSDADRQRAEPDHDTLMLSAHLFRQHGVLHLRNVFDATLLQQCHTAFLERYRQYLINERHKDALRIGDKRFQITIDIASPYDTPSLYGNPLLVELMQKLVGKDCILGCFTSAMSLPGSEDQRVHKDHKALFHDDPDATSSSCFAVTVMVPLVDTNETVGTTRVKKGSHRLTSKQSESLPWQTPLATVGDCYLMDYRLTHHGQANRSTQPRPILSMVYQRPWFRDYINFSKQPSLRIGQQAFEQIPDQLKSLLAWTNEPGPR